MTDPVVMKWFDLDPGALELPGGVLEVDEQVTPAGLALELLVCARPVGTVGVRFLEDGTELGMVRAGSA